MSWLSKFFGYEAKSNQLGTFANSKIEDDTYAITWRNKFLAARITHLDKQIKKKKIAGVISFQMPDDVQSGTIECLTVLNEKLEKRVKYLEGFFSNR